MNSEKTALVIQNPTDNTLLPQAVILTLKEFLELKPPGGSGKYLTSGNGNLLVQRIMQHLTNHNSCFIVRTEIATGHATIDARRKARHLEDRITRYF